MGQQESTVSGFSPFPISTKRDLYTNRDMMRTGGIIKKPSHATVSFNAANRDLNARAG
jgi:hypothetical protein